MCQLRGLSGVPRPARLAPSHPAGPAPSAQSETGLKVRCGLGWVAGWAGPEASLSHKDEAMGGLLAAGQPDYAARCAGWAGWAELCLGGLLDGEGLFHTHVGLIADSGPAQPATPKQTPPKPALFETGA